MGISISATNSKYEFNMGYGGFFNLRKNIALALDVEFGENYARLGSCIHERDFVKNDEIAKLIIEQKHLNDKYGDVISFLYMSDTGGSISYKTCRSILNLIKDKNFSDYHFQYARYAGEDYEMFKKFLKECYAKKRKMKWC